jgi:UDP:flavonoid glycosyltransferase YjiC (YdhE family)
MRVALAGYGGSRGHVEPLAALGRELVRRGHEACVGVDPVMIDFVESIGLEAVANLPELWDADFYSGAAIQNPVGVMPELMERSRGP